MLRLHLVLRLGWHGFELALACDLRLTTATARWCMPPAKFGILYSLSGMRRLELAVGTQRARYLIYTGAVLDGSRAVTWGLALEAMEDGGALQRRVFELLGELRSVRVESTRAAKQLLSAAETPVSSPLLRRSEKLRARLFAAADLPTPKLE